MKIFEHKLEIGAGLKKLPLQEARNTAINLDR
jgi:hypothetical protein